MRIGFAAPVSGSWATPDIITEVAGRADELGYASLWTFQRLLYPEGTALSDTYHSVLDPLITLGFLASCTTRTSLGVAIVNFPFISPILLAKQAAAIDVLSKGRLLLGVGLGWEDEEFVASNASKERRGARLEEYVEALDAIFTGTPDFAGEHYTIPRSEALPRPVQQPRPPLILGGVAPVALQRAGRIADGWVSSSRQDLRTVSEQATIVRQAAADAGRDPASLQVIVRGLVRLTAAQGSDRTPLTGSAEQIRADFADLESQGVDEVFIDLNFDPTIGSSAADPAASLAYAHRVLDSLAP